MEAAPGPDARQEPLVGVEVVADLLPVVAGLGVGAVVVADGRVHGDPREHVPVGLVEARVPVVVLAAALRTDHPALAAVDVVAHADHQPDVVLVDEPVEHLGHARLPAAALRVRHHPHAVVTEDDEVQRRVRAGLGVRPERGVVRAAGRSQVEAAAVDRPPVPALAGRPLLPVHQDAVAVVGVRLQAGEPDVVVLVGARRGDPRSRCLEDLDHRRAVRRRPRADALRPAGVDVVCSSSTMSHRPSAFARWNQNPPHVTSARSGPTSARCRNGSKCVSAMTDSFRGSATVLRTTRTRLVGPGEWAVAARGPAASAPLPPRQSDCQDAQLGVCGGGPVSLRASAGRHRLPAFTIAGGFPPARLPRQGARDDCRTDDDFLGVAGCTRRATALRPGETGVVEGQVVLEVRRPVGLLVGAVPDVELVRDPTFVEG